MGKGLPVKRTKFKAQDSNMSIYMYIRLCVDVGFVILLIACMHNKKYDREHYRIK